MTPTKPLVPHHRPASGTTHQAKAAASLLCSSYTPGDQAITAHPRSAGIDTIEIDVRRGKFRIVIDVAAADAVQVAALLAELTAPQAHTDGPDWVALGREAFNAGLEHPSPLSNPTVAAFIPSPSADPELVAEITARYRQGWDQAADDSARAALPYSYTAPNQPPPPHQPVYFVWDDHQDEVTAILLEPSNASGRLYRAHSADGRTRRVHARWIQQQRPATTAQAEPLLQRLTAVGFRLRVLPSMPDQPHRIRPAR